MTLLFPFLGEKLVNLRCKLAFPIIPKVVRVELSSAMTKD